MIDVNDRHLRISRKLRISGNRIAQSHRRRLLGGLPNAFRIGIPVGSTLVALMDSLRGASDLALET
ncbi:hypothetical protein [Novosphingobium sp.]|uniref:hypothetical protein n=1 Tax=Novosphingobium sp. TaxID=1874826 RepID=UPI002606792D|nr:hypothetical protein [Novosphingobium sp.]